MTKVDLVTGFLGAGKTTFIQYYAKWLQKNNIRFAVIENEFGEAGVDTAFLENTKCNVLELSGGCICCSLKVNFHDSILKLAQDYDRIIVEPSGIFDMDDFFDIMNSSMVAEKCSIGGVVTIVDPHSLKDMQAQDYDVLYSQLVSTDRVVFSKANNMDCCEIDEAIQELEKLFSDENGGKSLKSIVETAEWNTFTGEDFNRIMSPASAQKIPHVRRMINHSTIFNSTAVYPEKSFTYEEIQNVTASIFQGTCGHVLRIKGYVNSQNGSSLEVNCTVSNCEIKEHHEGHSPMLNIIGRNIRRSEIKKLLG